MNCSSDLSGFHMNESPQQKTPQESFKRDFKGSLCSLNYFQLNLHFLLLFVFAFEPKFKVCVSSTRTGKHFLLIEHRYRQLQLNDDCFLSCLKMFTCSSPLFTVSLENLSKLGFLTFLLRRNDK